MRYFICLMIGAILAFLGRYWLVEAESVATPVADLLTDFDGKLTKYLRNQASEISPGSPYPLLQKLNFFGL